MKHETAVCLDVLATLCRADLTQQEIADRVGVSIGTVNKRIKQLDAGAEPLWRDTPGAAAPDGRMAVLEMLRDSIISDLPNTTGTSRSNASKELRNVMAEIDALSECDDDDDPLQRIAEMCGA